MILTAHYSGSLPSIFLEVSVSPLGDANDLQLQRPESLGHEPRCTQLLLPSASPREGRGNKSFMQYPTIRVWTSGGLTIRNHEIH